MKPCLLLLLFSAMAAAQATEGDVLNALTGAPVAGAYVSARTGMGGEPVVTKTDVAGHFRLPATVPAYQPLQVVHAGFLRSERPIQHQAGQSAATIRIELTPAAVVSGKIVDEEGLPVEGPVQAMRYLNGERKLEPVGMTQSDDLGQYRLTNLAAGRYWIRAGSGSAGSWDRRYVGQYYPGTLRPGESGQIEVEAGRERDGVDIRLTKYDGVTVAGRVAMPAGSGPAQRQFPVLLEADPSNLEAFYGPLQRDDSFVIRHVPPGDYILRVGFDNNQSKAGDLVAEQKLRVGDADQPGIVLKAHELQPVDLAGTVLMKAGGNPPRMNIGLRDPHGHSASARSNEDGAFVLQGLLPGHYELQVVPDMKTVNGGFDPSSFAGAGYPVSAQLGEKEVLEAGFDLDGPAAGALRITLGSYIEIDGKLLDASGEPVPAGVLVAMPAGGSASRGGVAFTQADGSFRLMLRQPGDYHVYIAGEQGNLDDSDYLKKHEADFPPLRVRDGTNPAVALRLPER